MVTRVAVISDIHGNAPALRAVLAELNPLEVDALVCCGDVASGPLPAETVRLLQDLHLPLLCVRGNADRAAVASFDGTADDSIHPDDLWTGRQLSRDQRDFLADLPATITLEVDGLGEVLFCHGSPRRDDEILIETSPGERLRAAAEGVEAPTIVCGNTHMQFDRHVSRHRWVNVGSVGMPYGEPGAYWTLLGPDVEFRRSMYDLEAAADEIRRSSSWPEAERFAASNVLDPPSREEALQFFTELASIRQ